MKKTLSPTALLSAYKIGTAVLAALVGVFGTLAYLTSMTANGRYFTVSASVIILYVAIAVAVIFSFASAFLFPKGIGIESKSKIARYATVIPTVAISPVIASYAKELLGDANSTLTIIVAVSALISLIYFISTIFDLSKALSAFSGYILILFCIAVIAVLHTDSSVEMNSPVKISLQFTAAFTALSILSDIRNLIVGHSCLQYIFSKVTLLPLSILSLVGSLIAASRGYDSKYLTFSIFFFACAIRSSLDLFTASASVPQVAQEQAEIAEPQEDTAAESNAE